jgi:hypothetical protein
MDEFRTAEEHLSDEVAEAFSRGKLAEEQLAPAEEHLLCCSACRYKVEEWDDFIHVARVALKQRQEQPAKSTRWSHGRGWMAAIAFAALIVVVLVVPRPTLPETVVTLRSVRDSESSLAPAGRALVLKADTQGAKQAQSYRLQVVQTSGQVEREMPAISDGDHVSAKLERGLSAGSYWIRLCNENGNIVREFGLKVR